MQVLLILFNLILFGFLLNTAVGLISIFISFSKRFSKFIVNFGLKVGIKLRLIKDPEKTTRIWNEKVEEYNESGTMLKENKKLFSSQLINFIEKSSYSQKPLLSIRVYPFSNFSFLNFNKFTMYTVTTNISKSKKKLVRQQNLIDLFESFAAEEKIENSCTCDKCGDINYTYQKKDIHKFQILIIHIKRFKNEVEKNAEKIEFPQEIDLSKYNNKGNLGKYCLNSAVFHQGTLTGGHYTSIFKYLPTNCLNFIVLIPSSSINCLINLALILSLEAITSAIKSSK